VRRSGAALLQNFGPQALAQSVAKDPLHPYPPATLTADFQLCASGGDWMSGLLMQWVCQHNVFKHTARATLIKALREIYSGLDPGDAVRKIAGWPVTATFYTFFDGLIESCVNRGDSPLNIILYGVQEPASASVGALAAKPRPLLLVRGSLSKSDSLVLTEEDYEDLLENISQMPPTTASLARQTGSSVVFLGVSPRDPLVHALARKILETTTRRTHGPTFWVYRQPSEVDKAYWSRYAVEWIHHPTDQVIDALSDLKSS
jgi:hypothetical protein